MKKIFSFLLLTFVLCGHQAVRADDTPEEGAPTEIAMEKASDHYQQVLREHPECMELYRQRKKAHRHHPVRHGSEDQPNTLTEDQANTVDNPIPISLSQSPVRVSLQGDESNSSVYCSGAGCQHGCRWEYDNEGVDNDGVEMIMKPKKIIHDPFVSRHNPQTKISYQWEFWPKQAGIVTLTFKKYYYSNGTTQTQDYSSPWKEPLKEIHFTIQFLDADKN